MNIEIKQEIVEELQRFCKLNEIEDVGAEAHRCFISGFNVRKYGPTPVGQQKVVEKIVEVEKIIEKIIEKEIPITDDSKVQEFIEQINILKKEYENLQEITSDKDTQILSLSSQTQFYQTQLKGLKQEVEKRKGPLQRLMRGDFLSGSKLNKNLYDE